MSTHCEVLLVSVLYETRAESQSQDALEVSDHAVDEGGRQRNQNPLH